jgi:hypothetical protein
MATFVLTDVSVVVNSDDWSDHLRSMTLNLEQELVDDTNMGDTSKVFLMGWKNANFTLRLSTDFANDNVDNELWDIYDGGAAVTFVIKPTSAAVGANNPSYSGNCVLTSYNAIDGGVGDHAEITANFQVSGDVARNES